MRSLRRNSELDDVIQGVQPFRIPLPREVWHGCSADHRTLGEGTHRIQDWSAIVRHECSWPILSQEPESLTVSNSPYFL